MKNIIYIIGLASILFSCSGDPEIKVESVEPEIDPIDTYEERVAEIQKHSAILFADSLNFNTEIAEKLLASYEDYIKFHSFESDSKDYQFKAGELAKALNKPHIAIKHFNDLIERDPDHEKAPLALFYKAMIIGDMLHEDELAKATYQEFIDKYPEHAFVESAKASIELQGKSLDEIVKEFEQKNNAS
jgi:tetratricopeptide (TPR) repeat protein